MGVFVIAFIVSETTGNRHYQSEITFDEADSAQLDKKTQDVTIHEGELTDDDEDQSREYMETDKDHYPLQHIDLREKVDTDAETLNEILDGRGILENRGEAFLEAQDNYDINVMYLIIHSQLETGNRQSEL